MKIGQFLTSLLLTFFVIGGAAVSAAPIQDPSGPGPVITDIVAYCKKTLPKSLDKACTQDMATEAENVASNECGDNSNLQECITSTAEGYIRSAYDKKPKTVAQFNSALTDVYKSKGVTDTSTFNTGGQDPAIKCGSDKCDFIGKYVNPAIKAFSITFGLVAAISIIMGGIQYSTSEGDPQKSANAKKRILNTIIAVVAYIFLYSFLQFLVPGGLFNRGP
jgi:hypothetical protein